MANITHLRERLAIILCHEKKKRNMPRAELYMKNRMDGMTYTAIAKMYGVSHQAVSRACARYRRRMEKEQKDGK